LGGKVEGLDKSIRSLATKKIWNTHPHHHWGAPKSSAGLTSMSIRFDKWHLDYL